MLHASTRLHDCLALLWLLGLDRIRHLITRANGPMRTSLLGAMALAVAIGLGGCAPGAAAGESETPKSASESFSEQKVEKKPQSTPAHSEDVDAKTDPRVKADAPPAVLPSCEEMLPIDRAAEVIGTSTVQFYGQRMDADQALSSDRLGPAARAALSQAEEAVSCTWSIPNSDGFIFFSVFRIPVEARDEFLAALRASDYVETQYENAPIFAYDDGQQGLGAGLMRFAFVGPFVFHTSDPRESGPAEVVDGIRAANRGHRDFN